MCIRDSYCIDTERVADAMTRRTRAIVPVHLYGQVADMRALTQIADGGVHVIEDAAQAHGASRDGVGAGQASTAAAWSFYPGKNLGALGDAGAVTTDDPDVAATLRALREHGQRAKYDSVMEGYTARLDTIQAIALTAKLAHLEDADVGAVREGIALEQPLETLEHLLPDRVVDLRQVEERHGGRGRVWVGDGRETLHE